MIREQIKNVKVNGVYGDHWLLNYLKPVIMPHIPAGRKRFEQKKNQMRGIRFSTDRYVFDRIAGGLYRANFEPFDLSQEEIDLLIDKALIDCSSADWWYAVEKEYD